MPEFDTERAQAILNNYGGSGFYFTADGVLHVVVGTQFFKAEGEHIMFGPSDAMMAQAAIEKAQQAPAA